MNIRRIAMTTLLLLLCQQAGVLMAAVLHGDHSAVHNKSMHISTGCSDLAEHCDNNKSVVNQHHQQTDDCCNLNCECCVGHCQAGIANIVSMSVFAARYRLPLLHATSVPHFLPQNLLRPPIFA
ncbi:hypothetical protein IMCC21906_02026 [Spongiibacter sp. IMCC21906]|uniref:hypothetical protein n=1 Tax=Spongiibacter sp. IMCC21906 TaxID=1620392 RepID=UPI00062DE3D1|nr:hypothetical protein [Spongiibacter sp. IMCC21906]AKH69698.1 hypothetical protein IMCC21906_02026 [Spongiibacter sp. IMCC21906]